MIEATCAACGTVNRIAEADVPVGAKFVSCTSCKSKVPLPAAKAPAAAAPGKPGAPVKPVGIPAIPSKLPTPPKGVPAPAKSGAADLADLPAPKRQSPLAGAEPSKPAPRSALSGAELPVPKGMRKPPAPQAGSLDLDDLMSPAEPAGLADLPAPKARASALADLPAPKAAPRSALADLPAPKRATPPKGVPSPLSDLPTPKRATPPKGVPAPRDLTDLPAPKGPVGLTDLPMPKGNPAGGTLDLEDDLDLPMPKAGVTDLPMPKPGANNDLPAPKGFFDDLPQPAKKQGGIDLPAPKGFFDDLPQPARSPATQDLAPKGFFDDLPQPAKSSPSQDLAPKGLFDDLPHPTPAKSGGAAGGGGLFDDLPQPPARSAGSAPIGSSEIDLGPMSGPGLELDTSGPSLDLDMGGGASAGPELDSGLPLGEGAFQDLDLSEPTKSRPAEEASPIKIKTPAKGAASKSPIPINVPPAKGSDVSLDLAEDPHEGKGKGRPAAAAAAGGAKITAKKKPGQTEDTPEARAAKRKRSQIMLGAVLGIVALGGGGFYFYQRHAKAQAKADEIAADLAKAEKALQATKPDDFGHWQRAATAAEDALKLDETNPRAIGIAAEALIAGALDNGQNRDAKINRGGKLIQDALGAGRTSPEVVRASAIKAITAKGQAARAVDLLRVEIGKAPKDGWLQLYMGWAQLAKGDAAEAIKAFDQAIAMAPNTKVAALYGKGQAKLMLADVEGAKADFGSVLEIKKDHVCANIGLIATRPASESVQKVAELEAVLALKDINTADPKCRVQAITLIGDVHRAAGRLDMARQRYSDALKLQPNDGPTHDGLAAVELRDGKLDLAADHIQKALAVNGDDADALLLQAELAIKQGKLGDAEAQIGKLADHKPPLPTLAQAKLHVVRGKLLEAKGQPEAAIDEYAEGSKLAGELDLTPTMLAVTRLSDLAKKEADQAKAAAYRDRADKLLQAFTDKAQEDPQLSATIGAAYLEAGDPVKAETFLRRSVAMKGDDPLSKLQLAKALEAQQKIDDAIGQLKEAQTLDPKSTDIALELAKTYQNGGRHDEAIAAYDRLLAMPDVPTVVRIEAGRYFARHGLDLIAAGARDDGNKLIDKAAAQAEPILKSEPDNPAGLYLKGEGLLKAKKPEEAVPALTRASDNDPDVQYLDALGRALQARIPTDTKFIESARFAYERASKADPKVLHPWLGQGEMLIMKREFDAAIKALVNAVGIDKNNAEVAYNMGLAYYGLRTSSEAYKKTAAQWLEAALKASPAPDMPVRAEASHMLGDLYDNAMNRPAEAIRSYENSTRLAEELEKQTGKAPKWILDDLYELGDLYYKVNNKALQKKAFEKFYARSPRDGSAHWKAVNDALATSLKSY